MVPSSSSLFYQYNLPRPQYYLINVSRLHTWTVTGIKVNLDYLEAEHTTYGVYIPTPEYTHTCFYFGVTQNHPFNLRPISLYIIEILGLQEEISTNNTEY